MPEFQAWSVTRAVGFSETKTKSKNPWDRPEGVSRRGTQLSPSLGGHGTGSLTQVSE